jgi:predicted methyltransferase
MPRLLAVFISLALLGCAPSPTPGESQAATTGNPAGNSGGTAAEGASGSASARLAALLDAQPDEIKARYPHRNPQETLEFFGIEAGMTVVEALPGTGWYSRLLVPYLGPEGRLIGANYAHDMWPKFGFFDQEFIDRMSTWTADWPAEASEWHGADGAAIEAFEFGSMPAALEGQADAVLLIRSLHSLARFEGEGGYLTAALDDVYRVLKPGGIVGVVQHEARPEMSDDFASGAKGYLKRQFVIDRLAEAGFEFMASSAVNENSNDRPKEEDIVWRLPPTYATSREDPELRAAMEAIGESHRMTLKFRKPQ